jgi:hypothetical protein
MPCEGPQHRSRLPGSLPLLGSALVLLATALGFLAVLTLPNSQAGPPLPSLARAMAEGTMAFFFGLAILGIFTGVGVLRLKNWARISVLVWSGVTATICAFILAFLAFIPFPVPPNAGTPVNIATFVRLSIALVYGLPLAIAVWWLILFNRKTIAARFEAGIGSPLDPSGFPVEPTSASKPTLPLPITVLAMFLLFSSLSVFLIFFVHLPVLLFAHALRGPVGTVAWITTCLLSTAAGIGLLCRKVWSYWLTRRDPDEPEVSRLHARSDVFHDVLDYPLSGVSHRAVADVFLRRLSVPNFHFDPSSLLPFPILEGLCCPSSFQVGSYRLHATR